jgi:DnaJ-class molecular chaperone
LVWVEEEAMTDHYKVLGVPRTATKEEIKRAYRKKVMQVHPDRSDTPNEEEFIKVTKAYQMLLSVKKNEASKVASMFSAFDGMAPIQPSQFKSKSIDMTGWPACDYCNGLGESAIGSCPKCKGRGRLKP